MLAAASPLYLLRVLLKKGVYKGFVSVSHEGLDVCMDKFPLFDWYYEVVSIEWFCLLAVECSALGGCVHFVTATKAARIWCCVIMKKPWLVALSSALLLLVQLLALLWYNKCACKGCHQLLWSVSYFFLVVKKIKVNKNVVTFIRLLEYFTKWCGSNDT